MQTTSEGRPRGRPQTGRHKIERHVGFRVTHELWQQLKAEAEAEDSPVSEIVRGLIEDGMRLRRAAAK
jgi:hypothetical protein